MEQPQHQPGAHNKALQPKKMTTTTTTSAHNDETAGTRTDDDLASTVATTTVTTNDGASFESMRWLLLDDDDSSDHLMNNLLCQSSALNNLSYHLSKSDATDSPNDQRHDTTQVAVVIDDDDDSLEDFSCNIDIDDDMSSVMSDIGLLYDIDFDDLDETTSKFEHLVVPVSLVPHHKEQHKWNSNAAASTGRNVQANDTVNNDPGIHHGRPRSEKRKDQKQRRRILLLETQLLEIDKKFQQRQMYLQQIKHHRPVRLLQQIQHRELLSSAWQRNQLVQELVAISGITNTTLDAAVHPSHTCATDSHKNIHPHDLNDILHTHDNIENDQILRFGSNIYNFIVFEYYLTIPASMAILFHSIIMITIFDLVHDLVLYTYTDILPALYKRTFVVSSSLLLHYVPNFIAKLLEKHYDTMFQIAMFIVGVYFIHISGYLYWWLSDYDYTIMKYDTHNRIRLLRWLSQPFNCSDDDNDTVKYTVSTRQEHNSQNSHRCNYINTFVRRFCIVRRYPILRLMLYIIGYYILYMISQSILSATYPYFSQHDTILPHLPSAIFDKHFYNHLVDKHTMDDALPLSSALPNSKHSAFPCLVQNCHHEIERQQHANNALIQAERQYTKQRLAYMSYLGYWSTFVEQYGEKAVNPLFDTLRNRFYMVDDEMEDDDDGHEHQGEDSDWTMVDEIGQETEGRGHTSTIVDFHGTPVFNNIGEIAFGCVSLTIGILLLRGYGFIFWQKY
jgi:hypothetical protein